MKRNEMSRALALIMTTILGSMTAMGNETLPPLQDGKAPQTFEELWAGYDPKKEPLDIEVLKEWEEDGVVLKVLRYRIGIFKGQKAMMAAVYGFPKGGTKLPGLVQIHGGGQYADYKAPLTNAKRGYATISIAWAGRISAPGYAVNTENVKLFWEGKKDDPKYKVTTDWGPLDAYHAPCRNEKNSFAQMAPGLWTLDAVESPRNNPWFLCALGARRAITFLEHQPEIDPEKIGVYGHSMGGKIAVMTAGADPRIKAAAPSCGGVSDRVSDNPLYRSTIGDDVYLKHISCPVVFLNPSNDFHANIDDLQAALNEIGSKDWRVTCSAHANHQDLAEFQVAGPLWFDQYLKGAFKYPRTPETSLELKTADSIPLFTVAPDSEKQILAVDIYYTQQGKKQGEKRDTEKTRNCFWHHADAKQNGKAWTAKLPLLAADKPLWVYANVLYPLAEPVTGAGYYYGVYTAKTFNLSSRMSIVTPEQLKEAGVKITDKPSLVIERFEKDWQKEWFTYDISGNWARKTHKIYDDKYQAPPFAKLAFDVKSEKPNRLVVGLDGFAAEVQLKGGAEWQGVLLFPLDFHDATGRSVLSWKGLKELRLGPKETLRSNEGGKDLKLDLGGDWQGTNPEFRNLRWIDGTTEELNAKRTVKLANAAPLDGKTYLDIKYSDAFTHGYKIAMNTTLEGKPLVVDGKTYEHGIATHAPSEGIFFLGGKYKKFHAISSSGPQATVVFQIFLDDKKIYDSGLMTGAKFQAVDLPVENVQEMRLVVDDGGNGKGGDAGSWIDVWVE
jgi:cephalosporin-C deacetylase-like acetyl esterase